jgi:hypothetical protein
MSLTAKCDGGCDKRDVHFWLCAGFLSLTAPRIRGNWANSFSHAAVKTE